ncbi:MAG: fumarylacetoacetate hydrolase family protein [Hyphomicrobiales bacterium]
MRLISFEKAGKLAVGAVSGDDIVDLTIAAPDLPDDMSRFIAAGQKALDTAAAAIDDAPDNVKLNLGDIKLLPVVPHPGKIICLGLNYADHAAEGGHDLPTYPSLFLRTQSSLVAAGAPVLRTHLSDTLDFEAELLLVIGKTGRNITQADALDYVYGYSLFNDVSVREYQRKANQWTPGKNFDGTGPAGPWLVTADELPAGADGLKIESRLNGEVMQSSNTKNMIFNVPRTIEILSEIWTLQPGDIVAMGTPEGVGYARTPPVFMQPGDTVEIEIEGIGVLSNPIVAD